MPRCARSAFASSSVRAVVTMVMSMPRTLSTLSYTISGKISCSREPQRVVAAAVEALGRHALEVAHARQRHVDEPVEELVHPRRRAASPWQPIGTPSRSLKLAIDFLARVTTGFWPGDGLEVGGGEVQHLRVLLALAHPHVDHDLLQPRHLDTLV